MQKKPNGYRKDPQRIRAAAAECSRRTEFCKKYPAAYKHASALDLLDALFEANTITPDGVKKHSYSDWTNDELVRALKGYRTRSAAKETLGSSIIKIAR